MAFAQWAPTFVEHAKSKTGEKFSGTLLFSLYKDFQASYSIDVASSEWLLKLLQGGYVELVNKEPPEFSWAKSQPQQTAQALDTSSVSMHVSPGGAPEDISTDPFWCDVCYVDLPVANDPSHMKGKRHRTAIQRQQSTSPERKEGKESKEERKKYDCTLCNLSFASKFRLSNHEKSEQHQQAVQDAGHEVSINLKAKFQRIRDGLELGTTSLEQQNGVSIQPTGQITQQVQLGSECDLVFTVTNHGDQLQTMISGLLEKRKEIIQSDVESTTLTPKTQHKLKITCKPTNAGFLRTIVCFNFGTWIAFRMICLEVKKELNSPEVSALLPTSEYTRPKLRPRAYYTDIVPGEAPPLVEGSNIPFVRILAPYRTPVEIAALSGEDSILEYLARKGLLPLTAENHQQLFSTLLHIEEVQLNKDIRQYDLQNQTVEFTKSRVWLLVPGLAEKRPSVQVSDKIYLFRVGSNSQREYEGYVHEIQGQRVLLGFGPAFAKQHSTSAMYDVRFTFNRLPLRRMHGALAAADGLFPAPTLDSKEPPELKMINSHLNKEQACAVRHIVHRTHKDAFYVVFGPPGTGKTTTIIEAMKQILKRDPSARLLCCAPSNEACDLLVEKLHPMSEKAMQRVCAFHRPTVGVSSEVMKYVNVKAGKFALPSKEALLGARVVVSTCSTAALFASIGVAADHFTHVFLDEGGYALEPEALIPFTERGNASRIIAGDPMQLGPIVRSLATSFGLALSLLERLCQMSLYAYSEDHKATQGHNAKVITKLVRNYRSHPAIISLPSELFYRNQLISQAGSADRSSLCAWPELPAFKFWASKASSELLEGEVIIPPTAPSHNPDECASITASRTREFPLVFHGVVGRDVREANSPSFFNVEECVLVRDYILNLKRDCGLSDEDFGVVTPYRKQVQKIRQLLRTSNLDKIKAGSVEEFQGQERRVIIISCVRSSTEFLSYDAKYNLGFVGNSKRFNVAITRARHLVVVIGNPHVLQTDPNWREYMKYCKSKHGNVGCELPPFDAADIKRQEDELVSNLNRLNIQDDSDNKSETEGWALVDIPEPSIEM